MSEVFFSFANEDKEAVLPLIDLVERSGFSVWQPGMISKVDSYLQRRNDEIATAKCVVVFWSAAAAASRWVQAEMRRALEAWSSDRLVLVAIDEEQLSVGLRDLAVIALRGSPKTGVNELVKRVRAVISAVHGIHITERRVDTVGGNIIGRDKVDVGLKAARAQRGDERLGSSGRASLMRQISRWMIALAWARALVLILLVLLPRALPPTLHPAPKGFPPTLHPAPKGTYLLLLVVMVLTVGAAIGGLTVWGWTIWSRRRWKAGSQPFIDTQYSVQEEGGTQQIFVSYSRQDASTVDRIVDQIVNIGYAVWIDRQITRERAICWELGEMDAPTSEQLPKPSSVVLADVARCSNHFKRRSETTPLNILMRASHTSALAAAFRAVRRVRCGLRPGDTLHHARADGPVSALRFRIYDRLETISESPNLPRPRGTRIRDRAGVPPRRESSTDRGRHASNLP